LTLLAQSVGRTLGWKSNGCIFESCTRSNFCNAYFVQPLFWRLYVVAVLVALKGWVHCFSMQFVMNKCYTLNFEKLAQIRLVVWEKHTFYSEKWHHRAED